MVDVAQYIRYNRSTLILRMQNWKVEVEPMSRLLMMPAERINRHRHDGIVTSKGETL